MSSICGVGGKPPRSLMLPLIGPALSLLRRVPRLPQLLPRVGMGDTTLLGCVARGDSGGGTVRVADTFANRAVRSGSPASWLGSSFGSMGSHCFNRSDFCGASALAGTYVMSSRPFEPSTRNSLGYEARKCFRPWSVFFKYSREPGDSATPSMLRSNSALPGILMCCRHSSSTCCLVIPSASASSSWQFSTPSPTAFLNRSLLGRSE
mmetsp:Transcript_33290/g.79827  ORF Transcript_33290/g.79827 Transcript_33290/m.79827 type:complete len:207 (-) Transcript_33290:783-1403(-)